MGVEKIDRILILNSSNVFDKLVAILKFTPGKRKAIYNIAIKLLMSKTLKIVEHSVLILLQWIIKDWM